MNTARETNHFNVNEIVFVCSDTLDEGTGNFEINDNNKKTFKICGIGSKPLPIRLKPQSTKIKDSWGALKALRDFSTTLQGCDITFFTDSVGVVKLFRTGNWADASLPKCISNIVPGMKTLHKKVEHLPNTTEMLNFVGQISRNKLYLKKWGTPSNYDTSSWKLTTN